MERHKRLSRQELLEAVDKLVERYGAEGVPVDSLPPELRAGVKARSSDASMDDALPSSSLLASLDPPSSAGPSAAEPQASPPEQPQASPPEQPQAFRGDEGASGGQASPPSPPGGEAAAASSISASSEPGDEAHAPLPSSAPAEPPESGHAPMEADEKDFAAFLEHDASIAESAPGQHFQIPAQPMKDVLGDAPVFYEAVEADEAPSGSFFPQIVEAGAADDESLGAIPMGDASRTGGPVVESLLHGSPLEAADSRDAPRPDGAAEDGAAEDGAAEDGAAKAAAGAGRGSAVMIQSIPIQRAEEGARAMDEAPSGSESSSRHSEGSHDSSGSRGERGGSASGSSLIGPARPPQPVALRTQGPPGEQNETVVGGQAGAGPPPLDMTQAPDDDQCPPSWGRYPLDGELARGGQGRILKAFDTVIGRPVALKILKKAGLKDTRLVSRFYEEAQVTGQLEHPNIVPVYELSWLDNGLPYYVMKRVEGRTLKKVIIGLRKRNPQLQAQFGRVKLMTILQQVCQAISYAHDRGVIHRDLKPANIMLGDYGEVIVLDWGVAKVRSLKEPDSADAKLVRIVRRGSALETQAGTVEGTPAYMSPEQARGRIDEIDERSDIYALGAILYELLTYRPPFRGKDVRDVLRRVVEEMPPRPSRLAPDNQIPEELENLAMKCMAKNPDERFSTVKELQAELEAFLEGTKRREAAAQKVAEARKLVEQHEALKRELLLAKMVARRAGQGIQGWEPIERKRGVWATRTRVRDIEAKSFVTFGEAVARFSQALAHQPDNKEAKDGLADLFAAQLRKAESEKDHASVVYCESMIKQYGGDRYAAFLSGEGSLSLESDPPRAEVWLYRYEENDRILRAVEARRLGIAPIVDVRLPRGSYLVILRAKGMRDVYYPIRLGRLEAWKARVRMYTHAELGEGFVYVPGGPFQIGGDPEAIDGYEQEIRTINDFAIQEFPVTFREYLEFLNAWLAVDPKEAQARVPELENGQPLAMIGTRGYVLVPGIVTEGRQEHTSALDIPVYGIDFDDADAYCAWRSELTGIEHRLPTDEEWEKAARGVDGRVFPWGDQFDPTFCKSRLSRPWAPEPEPVGNFPEDTSPYGVRDMAGGVREWCEDWYNEAQNLRVLRGGSWVDPERFLRCASRSFYDPHLMKRVTGFRCVRDLG